MKKNYTIVLSNITKDYIIHHDKPTLMERIFMGKNEKFRALSNINLKVGKGEIIGIIGPNGSGKSTLLKIIAGITSPNNGDIHTYGKTISLIDLEAGFHPDLTGLQNIYLNGMVLGLSKQQIDKNLKNIIAFADIGKFIDAQLFTYSEGMKLRLGFSIIAYSEPDILILDEGFLVGDADFQKKASNKIKEFNKNGTSIVIVSHWFEFINKTCKRVVIMKKGRIVYDGPKKPVYEYSKY